MMKIEDERKYTRKMTGNILPMWPSKWENAKILCCKRNH